jgi:hypothetical protein
VPFLERRQANFEGSSYTRAPLGHGAFRRAEGGRVRRFARLRLSGPPLKKRSQGEVVRTLRALGEGRVPARLGWVGEKGAQIGATRLHEGAQSAISAYIILPAIEGGKEEGHRERVLSPISPSVLAPRPVWENKGRKGC